MELSKNQYNYPIYQIQIEFFLISVNEISEIWYFVDIYLYSISSLSIDKQTSNLYIKNNFFSNANCFWFYCFRYH